MALFSPERHEALTATAWNEAAVRSAIERILEDVQRGYAGVDALWPVHPIDLSPERANPRKPLYYGAAGVIWALSHLEQAGFAASGRDYRPVLDDLAERDRVDWLQLGRPPERGYTIGAAGIHMLHWKLAPSQRLEADVARAIEDTREHPEPETDALLLAAGELTWAAGPLAKLPSLCHGAPGSGYAFLKLYARTADERWLDRARRFAMHAIEQSERGKAQYGQRKFSLWTGDLGLACYLWDCVRVSSAFPTLDFF